MKPGHTLLVSHSLKIPLGFTTVVCSRRPAPSSLCRRAHLAGRIRADLSVYEHCSLTSSCPQKGVPCCGFILHSCYTEILSKHVLNSCVLYVKSRGTLKHLQEAQNLTQNSPLATFLPLPYTDQVFCHSLPMVGWQQGAWAQAGVRVRGQVHVYNPLSCAQVWDGLGQGSGNCEHL